MQNNVDSQLSGKHPRLSTVGLNISTASPSSLQRLCGDCFQHSKCLACRLDNNELMQYSRNVKKPRRVNNGSHLFRMSDPFKSIFTVLSGSIKIYRLDDEGHEQIVGFRMPGDLVGIDAIGTEAYSTSAVALETCFLCEISYAKFEQSSYRNPALQHEMALQLSKVIRAERMHGLSLAGTSAEYRVARFLIDTATQLSDCRFGPHNFTLSMSRSDIANYLGLAMETVSRTFTQFRDKKLISVRRKSISIPDIGLLENFLTEGLTKIVRHRVPVFHRTIATNY